MSQQYPPSSPDRPRRRPRSAARRLGDDQRMSQPGSQPSASQGADQAPPSFQPTQRRSPQRRSVLPSSPASSNGGEPAVEQISRASMPPSFAPKARSRSRQAPAYAPREHQGAAMQAPTAVPPMRHAAPKPGQPPRQRLAHPGRKQPQQVLTSKQVRAQRKRRKRRNRRIALTVLVVLLAIVIGWPAYLFYAVNSEIKHVDALSNRGASSGETWLIAGSDTREGPDAGVPQDGTQGQRSDSIMLVHKASNGQTSVVSLPRDTRVNIPGRGVNKLNASFALGGPPLLVKTVEDLTGITIDHYVQVTMGGVTNMVDAVGGVNLCYDRNVNDHDSGMTWTKGCHDVNGQQALAFARMRNQDPLGDIGRAKRQRQVIEAVIGKATDPYTLMWPSNQLTIGRAGGRAIVADNDSGAWDIGMMVLAYRSAASSGLMGAPPISSLGFNDGVHGSMVILDKNKISAFWNNMENGSLTKDSFNSLNP